VRFILGARLRAVKEIREKVLTDPGAYQQVHGPKARSKEPVKGKRFEIDKEKVKHEAQFDGTWVLQTDAPLTGVEVALKYKELWMVEAVFRCLKSVLETRPIYHKCDDTIRGHVFCSFLALVLLNELQTPPRSPQLALRMGTAQE
jgi:hypothetical protein